jgi:hypothetical protein
MEGLDVPELRLHFMIIRDIDGNVNIAIYRPESAAVP